MINKNMYAFLETISHESGKIALEMINTADKKNKSYKNIVTEADIKIENFLKKEILKKYPNHNIISEESDIVNNNSPYTWYVDPIDGTANYSHKDINFCISIALAKQNRVINAAIYIPILREFYYAERGKGAYLNKKKLRVSPIDKIEDSLIHTGISPFEHSINASLKIFRHFMLKAERAKDYGFCAGELAFVAAGRAEALIKKSQHPWDIAAGMLIVEEAGGKITDINGNEIDLTKKRNFIVATNSLIHEEVLNELAKVLEDNNNEWFS